MAEIELACSPGNAWTVASASNELTREMAAWETKRNGQHPDQLALYHRDARIKLKRLYPSIKTDRALVQTHYMSHQRESRSLWKHAQK